MDDQNNGNQGGGVPPAAEPMQPAAEQPQEQKCMTCGTTASGGNCVACGQGEVSCTCPPATGGEQGSSEPAPSAPAV